jgi:hypothetical protein
MTPADADAWVAHDPTVCDTCGREACEDHIPGAAAGLPADALDDAAAVAAEGRRIAAAGIDYVIDGIVPRYGMVGMSVAYAKVGKTTFGHAVGASAATGRRFLERPVVPTRVLCLAAEDPPEYTAWLARHLVIPAGRMTFYRRSLIFDQPGLDAVRHTVTSDRYGLVLVSSWQAVTVGLLRDENDNAGAVAVMQRVRDAARASGVPWLIDAHSGKGEDQSDDADPTRALRGASAAAGAADFMLSLRYADGSFGTRRRLSGKGRFVSLAPLTIDYTPATGQYELVGEARAVALETTWRLLTETGAISDEPRSVTEIARVAGMVDADGRLGGQRRKDITGALRGRPNILRAEVVRRGQKTTVYSLVVAS